MTNRLIACLFILVLLLGVLPLAAQEDTYVVQKGDTLYVLEGTYNGNPNQWRRLLELNPYLNEPGRIFRDSRGRTIVILHEGKDKLVGLQALGIIPNQVPIESLKLAQPDPIKVPTTPEWVWWLLGILAILALWLLGILRRTSKTHKEDALAQWRESVEAGQEIRRLQQEIDKRREPEQLGTPFVVGGINPTQTEDLQDFFRDQAVDNYIARRPEFRGSRYLVRPTLVGQIEHGMLSGEGMVGDLDGNWHNSLIDAPGRPGYQARFRYPDGTEELMQSYQACMNPVRAGEGMRGFTFVPDPETAQAAPTESVPAPAA